MTTPSERALIGSLLLDPSNVSHVVGDVAARDFEDIDLGSLFDALVTLHEAGRPIGDITILVPELKRMRLQTDVADGLFIIKLTRDC